MATIEELQRLREELASKKAKVGELEKTLAELQRELARLKGEPVPPVAAIPEAPWYKRWAPFLFLGGIGAIITGIIVKKRKK